MKSTSSRSGASTRQVKAFRDPAGRLPRKRAPRFVVRTGRGECDPQAAANVCCNKDCTLNRERSICGSPTHPYCEGTRRCDGTLPTCPAGPPIVPVGGCTYPGPCGAQTQCDGQHLDCPPAFQPQSAAFECAPETECALAAECGGQSADCPAAVGKAAGLACGDNSDLCVQHACDGNGACQIRQGCQAQPGCRGSACKTIQVNCTLARAVRRRGARGRGLQMRATPRPSLLGSPRGRTRHHSRPSSPTRCTSR